MARVLELMAAGLRSLLSAYAGLWTSPVPAAVPADLRRELRHRLAPTQLESFAHLPVD